MFEKEAEERTKQYMNKHTEKYNCENTKLETDNYNVGREQGYEDGFQDGAEFGYKLAHEEMDYLNKHWGSEEERKTNEWHFPSKGEYPKDEKNVLCILGDFKNINLEVGYYSQKENERERWRFSEYSTPDDSEDAWGVSAWKEIVLPELKESE